MVIPPPHRLLVPLLVLATLPVVAAPVSATTVSYGLSFQGTFRLTFAVGPDLTDELTFVGHGGGDPLGDGVIEGLSYARSGPDGCASIVHDEVTFFVGDSQLWLENEGEDCIDLVSSPGHVLIHGSGATTIVGGSGSLSGASGSGTWTVSAEVTSLGPGYVEGEFSALRFSGDLHL